MNATRKSNSTTPKILVDTKELATMLSIGTLSARNVGEQANAVVRIGKRRLYNVQKIQAYIDEQ